MEIPPHLKPSPPKQKRVTKKKSADYSFDKENPINRKAYDESLLAIIDSNAEELYDADIPLNTEISQDQVGQFLHALAKHQQQQETEVLLQGQEGETVVDAEVVKQLQLPKEVSGTTEDVPVLPTVVVSEIANIIDKTSQQQ